MGLVLNSFDVDRSLARLMRRPDWVGKRTGPTWLDRFPAHPASEEKQLPFVQLCSPETLHRENSAARKPELAMLLGKPDADYPPGNFDPEAGYVIGFTDFSDSAICVDLRPPTARIIYECWAPQHPVYATAFQTIADFVTFYVAQHGP